MSSGVPPHVVADFDQREAADAAVLESLMETYRAAAVRSGREVAVVAVTLAGLAVGALGAGDRIVGALAVAVARLCEAESEDAV